MEWELQQAGFDYTYDKRLYDRLVAQNATPVREHLWASGAFQDHSLRFIENHDETRAAGARPLGGGGRLRAPLAALQRAPRRAPGGGHVPAAGAPGGGGGGP